MSLKEKINNCSTKFENPNLDNVENSDDAFTAMTKLKENAFSWHHDMLAIFEIENFLFTQEAKQRIIHAESLVKQFVKLKKKFTENYNKKIPTENCLDEKEQIELHNINFQLSYERCGSDVLKLDLINQLILIETSVYRNLPFIINEEVENMIHYLDNKINE